MACGCGCDWPPCVDGCVSPARFRLWKWTHLRAYFRYRARNREE
jgi:hypothetical protein